MKITKEKIYLISEQVHTASSALAALAKLLEQIAKENGQPELSLSDSDPNTRALAEAVPAFAENLTREAAKTAILRAGYSGAPVVAPEVVVVPALVSDLCANAAAQMARPDQLPGLAPASVTRASLRALAEKLVAQNKLPEIKVVLAEFGAANLSALKPESYEAANVKLLALLS